MRTGTAAGVVAAVLAGLGGSAAALRLPASSAPAAQEPRIEAPAAARGRQLVVATKPAEPFVIAEPDGTWGGLSIELWRRVALDLGLDHRFEERTLDGMLEEVAAGRADAAVAALTVTSERMERMDFCHPFLSSGLGIAVPARGGSFWITLLRRLLSPEFLGAVGALLLLLLSVGGVVWLLERRKNREQFGGPPGRGLASGLWWSAVTMTTVGYGDKAPTTLPGRLVAVGWMFASVILVSTFTAAIASSLTVASLESSIRGPEDLRGVRVGSVDGTTSAAWLADARVSYRRHGTVREALDELAAGRLDAVVYDAPILRWLASREHAGEVTIVPGSFQRQDYAFAVPPGSELRKPLNRALLRVLTSEDWAEVVRGYLGG